MQGGFKDLDTHLVWQLSRQSSNNVAVQLGLQQGKRLQALLTRSSDTQHTL
jgi:hypothetical protein